MNTKLHIESNGYLLHLYQINRKKVIIPFLKQQDMSVGRDSTAHHYGCLFYKYRTIINK